MRSAPIIVLPLACLAGSALAQETGAGLRVETRPDGAIAIFASPTEAQAACTGAGGGFGLEGGRFTCVNPRRPLQSTQTEVAPAATLTEPDRSETAGRGIAVDSFTLQPGERVSFTLSAGNTRQLLTRAEPSAPGAITVHYEAGAGGSRLTVTSRTGHALQFRLLADPDGNGGFSPMGEIDMPGDGSPVTRSWPTSLGAISIGNFRRASPE